MKIKKLISKILSVSLGGVMMLSYGGCALFGDAKTPVSIVSIEKTSSEGLEDTYTIYYSDGKTSTFKVMNGADGKDGENGKDGTNGTNGINGTDGKDVTALDLYETYKEIYGEDLTYAEFLAKYLSFEGKTEEETHTVINDCLKSVGKVYCEFEELDTTTTAEEATIPAVYSGACVIYRIDQDYTYFLTNYHVVHDEDAVGSLVSDKINCYLYGSEGYPSKLSGEDGKIYYDYGERAIQGEYIGGSIQYDLAIFRAKTETVLKINENVKAVTFADDYYVGETAIAIGNPKSQGISVTQGIVSVDNEYITLSIDGISRTYRSIRIDTALYHGNSGGGLFNSDGELIGIANAGNITDQNINYAVPIQIVKAVTDNIMYYYHDGDDSTNGVYKITVGVTVTAKSSKYVYDAEQGFGKIVEEILVLDVGEGTIAERIGLRKDDMLKSLVINGDCYKLSRYFEIGDLILSMKDGDSFYFIMDTGETSSSYTLTSADFALAS